jgi:hypothetical protein
MAIFGPRVGHDALFDEVCKFHTIDRKTKPLLQSIIKKYQVSQPAEIFIDPEILRHALEETECVEEKDELQKLYDAWFTDQSLVRRKKLL